jgi:hypothetical protein
VIKLATLGTWTFRIDVSAGNFILTVVMAAKKEASSKQGEVTESVTEESTKNTQERVGFPPEVLADLAIKLEALKNGGSGNSSHSNCSLSHQVFGPDFQDALKAAENLLLAASGQTDEVVHAYQLFSVEDGLMSFAEIAERFRDFGWDGMKAPGTVEKVIVKLVENAELEVQKERERHDKLVSVRLGYPGGVHDITARVRRHMRSLIRRTKLRDLFKDETEAADAMGQFFYRLMDKGIPGDWEKRLEEELFSLAGYDSFIKHVCGGLTYEQFMKHPPHVLLNLERLGCLVFFLELLGEELTDYESSKHELKTLIRLVSNRNEVAQSIMSELNDCLEELQKEEPQTRHVRKFASIAGASLRAIWDRWYLVDLVEAQELGKLIREIEDPVHKIKETADFSAAGFEEILEDVKHLTSVVSKPSEGFVKNEDLRKLLEELRLKLNEGDLLAAAEVKARGFNGLVSDQMKRIASGLRTGLEMKRPLKMHLLASLRELLTELRPYDGNRKCCPYELLLFAAQNKLENGKFVCRRSSLVSMPNPPYPFSLSILEGHEGVPY